MKTNRRMADLLAGSAGAAPIELPGKLHTLVNLGFKEVDGCVFFRDFFRHDRADGLPLHQDATGYECAVNGFHLEDYLERDAAPEPVTLAATALACARFLAARLEHFSTDPFRIIASVANGASVLRFHKLREGERWLRDDLEGYREEAVLVLDSRVSAGDASAQRRGRGPMREEHAPTRFERLKAVRWGSAPAWSLTARDLLFDFYERVLPFWPDEETRFPSDELFSEPFSSRLSDADRARVGVLLSAVLESAHAKGDTLTGINRPLVELILACDVLSGERGQALAVDPSEPLLQLFEAGYDLGSTHGAVDIFHEDGFTTVPLPTREAIARRAAAHRSASV